MCSTAIEFDTHVIISVRLKHRSESQLLEALQHLRAQLVYFSRASKPFVIDGDLNE